MAADYTFTNADYQELPIQEFSVVSNYANYQPIGQVELPIQQVSVVSNYANYHPGSYVELTETGSGGDTGGGSARPVSGMIYPRGN